MSDEVRVELPASDKEWHSVLTPDYILFYNEDYPEPVKLEREKVKGKVLRVVEKK